MKRIEETFKEREGSEIERKKITERKKERIKSNCASLE